MTETKTCGGPCRQELPTDSFGIAKHRKDGRNLYCKACALEKAHAYRQEIKDFNIKRKPGVIAKKDPLDKVKEAMESGAHTRESIKQVTRLTMNEVVDSLALLTFDQSATVIRVVNGERRFYLA